MTNLPDFRRLFSVGVMAMAFYFQLFSQAPSDNVKIEYMGHLQSRGDTEWVAQNEQCGTKKEGRAMEGFAIRLASGSEPIKLRYRAHLQGSGDTGWYYMPQYCGTREENRRMEAIWIEVVGGYEDKYEIYYRAHISGQKQEWTGWYKNGEMCGRRGTGRAIEAIEIFVSP